VSCVARGERCCEETLRGIAERVGQVVLRGAARDEPVRVVPVVQGVRGLKGDGGVRRSAIGLLVEPVGFTAAHLTDLPDIRQGTIPLMSISAAEQVSSVVRK
jgi:hypothetical protein